MIYLSSVNYSYHSHRGLFEEPNGLFLKSNKCEDLKNSAVALPLVTKYL